MLAMTRVSLAAPERSLEQRMDALGRANAIRSHRARVKREIKAGERSVVDELLDVGELMETMKVYDLLLAVPKFGRVKVNTILSRNQISPSKTIGGLSKRQRRVLVLALAARTSAYRGIVQS